MSGSLVVVRRLIGGGNRSPDLQRAVGRTAPAPSAKSRNEASIGEFLVVAHETQVTSRPPFVIDVFGEVAPNGNAIGLRIQRSEQGPVDICLRIEDVQHIVSILLVLSCEAKRLQPPPEFDTPPSETIPLPLSAINVGQDDHEQTFLMLEVGATSLMVGLPPAAVEEVAQTLLALSARASTKPS
jgi:hypothetical protein